MEVLSVHKKTHCWVSMVLVIIDMTQQYTIVVVQYLHITMLYSASVEPSILLITQPSKVVQFMQHSTSYQVFLVLTALAETLHCKVEPYLQIMTVYWLKFNKSISFTKMEIIYIKIAKEGQCICIPVQISPFYPTQLCPGRTIMQH